VYLKDEVYPPDGHFIGKMDEKCIEPWDLGDFGYLIFRQTQMFTGCLNHF
jgi:hypothetical protein